MVVDETETVFDEYGRPIGLVSKVDAVAGVNAFCDPHRLEDGLAVLVNTQTFVSGTVPGAFDAEMFPAYVLALVEEVHEAAREARWKPWTRRHGPPNRDATLAECADVLAFLGLFFIHVSSRLEMPVDEFVYQLAGEYRKTSLDNVRNHASEHEHGSNVYTKDTV